MASTITVVTTRAKNKILEARAGNAPIPPIKYMAFGDGGQGWIPTGMDNALQNELLRKEITGKEVITETQYRYKCLIGTDSRVWSNTYKVPQRGKLTASLSAAVVAYDGKINSVGLDVLNTAGSVILVASPNGTTDLSSLAGQTVKLRFKCTNTIHIAFRATFSVLTISNK